MLPIYVRAPKVNEGWRHFLVVAGGINKVDNWGFVDGRRLNYVGLVVGHETGGTSHLCGR